MPVFAAALALLHLIGGAALAAPGADGRVVVREERPA